MIRKTRVILDETADVPAPDAINRYSEMAATAYPDKTVQLIVEWDGQVL